MSTWTIESIRMPDGTPVIEVPAKYEGVTIKLLTPRAFEDLPNGSVVVSIHGEEKTKGTDRIDQDTRGGCLAWGLKE